MSKKMANMSKEKGIVIIWGYLNLLFAVYKK